MSRPINIDQEEMRRYVQLLRPEVAKHLDIVTKAQLGQDVLYHIAGKRQKEMFPFISKRGAWSEDNTVPRIHVAPSLLGCCLGYGNVGEHAITDVAIGSAKDKTQKLHPFESDWRGGFYIHELMFEAALRPGKKLVYDALESDEMWLVTYNELTRVYPSPVIGKMVIKSVEYLPRVGRSPEIVTNMVVEITSPTGMRLDGRKRLSKGWWAVKMKDISVLQHKPISREDFLSVKEYSAALLSYRDDMPAYLKWRE